MKNIKFFFILSFLFLFLIEIFSYFAIKNIKKSHFIKIYKDFKEKEYNPEVVKNYSEFIPYSRNKINFNQLNDYIIKDDKSYFYSIIKDFDKKNIENILIQGDSWAEIANKKEIFNNIKKYSNIKNVGIINAGISSFSPSPMASQLFILEKEFKLKPSIIIAIIDQTDIGDELFRYRTLDKSSFSPVLTNLHKEFYSNVLLKLNTLSLSSFKLFFFMKSYFELNKTIHNFDNLKTLKIISKKVKSKFFKLPMVLSPLRFGINSKEKEIFKKKVINYINIAFTNNKLKKIYFVTHPHYNHLSGGKYKLNINILIDEIINETIFSNKIKHINFLKLEKTFDKKIYEENDVFSHLTTEAYNSYFYPKIFDTIDF